MFHCPLNVSKMKTFYVSDAAFSILTHLTATFALDVSSNICLRKSLDHLVLIRDDKVHIKIFVICDREIAVQILLGSVLRRKIWEEASMSSNWCVGETIEMSRRSPLWFFFPKGVFRLLLCVRLHVWAVLWCFTCYFQLTFNCFPQFLEAPICSIMTSLCSRCVFNKKALLSLLWCSCNWALCLCTTCFRAFWWDSNKSDGPENVSSIYLPRLIKSRLFYVFF